jgi:hypothetical protein
MWSVGRLVKRISSNKSETEVLKEHHRLAIEELGKTKQENESLEEKFQAEKHKNNLLVEELREAQERNNLRSNPAVVAANEREKIRTRVLASIRDGSFIKKPSKFLPHLNDPSLLQEFIYTACIVLPLHSQPLEDIRLILQGHREIEEKLGRPCGSNNPPSVLTALHLAMLNDDEREVIERLIGFKISPTGVMEPTPGFNVSPAQGVEREYLIRILDRFPRGKMLYGFRLKNTDLQPHIIPGHLASIKGDDEAYKLFLAVIKDQKMSGFKTLSNASEQDYKSEFSNSSGLQLDIFDPPPDEHFVPLPASVARPKINTEPESPGDDIVPVPVSFDRRMLKDFERKKNGPPPFLNLKLDKSEDHSSDRIVRVSTGSGGSTHSPIRRSASAEDKGQVPAKKIKHKRKNAASTFNFQ